jgi:DNA-binding winged helix-turn-helix (wHTH) protein/Tfp pilus assembly protein PilF
VIYVMGPLSFDKSQLILYRDGVRLVMRPKVCALLAVLADNAGTLVSRDELMSKIWPDKFVEDKTLSMLVVQLRRTLSEHLGPDSINTQLGGYRLNVPVRALSPTAAHAEARNVQPTHPRLRVILEQPVAFATDTSSHHCSASWLDAMLGAIANEIDVELIDASVATRWKSAPPQGDIVLCGSIRLSDAGLKMTANLKSPHSGHVWWRGEAAGDPEDAAALAEQLAREVVTQVHRVMAWPGGHRRWPSYARGAVYDDYAFARHACEQRTARGLSLAQQMFEKALVENRGFTPALLGLAECLSLKAFYSADGDANTLARAAGFAQRAIELDQDKSSAYATLSFIKLSLNLLAEAHDCSQRAIELDPTNALAYHRRSDYLAASGDPEEALVAARLAVSLDPRSVSVNGNLGHFLFHAGHYAEAEAQLMYTLGLNPDYAMAHCMLGLIQIKQKQLERSLFHCSRAVELSPTTPIYRAALGLAKYYSGDTRLAREQITLMQRESLTRPEAADGVILLQAGLGNTSDALKWLKFAARFQASWTIFFRDPSVLSRLNCA